MFKNALRRLYAASIWHPGAIPKPEYKYRNLKRVYLPAYDLIVVYIGIMGALFGSELLNRIFHPELVDAFSIIFSVVGIVCFLGIAFPRLWAVEMVSKIVLLGMLGGYVASIIFYGTRIGETSLPNLFVIGMIALGFPVVLFRLELLGIEYRERKEMDKAIASIGRH